MENRRYRVRFGDENDLPEVLQIERDSFEEPWDAKTLRKYLRQREAIFRVVDLNGLLAGYVVYMVHPLGYIEISSLAVAEDSRRQGCGTILMDFLKGYHIPIAFDVHESNLPGQLFFKACGCRAVDVVDNFYDDGETAYLFRWNAEQTVTA